MALIDVNFDCWTKELKIDLARLEADKFTISTNWRLNYRFFRNQKITLSKQFVIKPEKGMTAYGIQIRAR